MSWREAARTRLDNEYIQLETVEDLRRALDVLDQQERAIRSVEQLIGLACIATHSVPPHPSAALRIALDELAEVRRIIEQEDPA